MDRLLAKDAILNTVYKFIESEDELDRELCLSLFEPDKPITLDLSRHVGMPPMEITPTDFFEKVVVLALSGFEATHHMLGNEMVEFDGDNLSKARCTSKVRGYHCLKIDDEHFERWTGQGILETELEKHNDKWVIRKISIIRSGPGEKHELYKMAREKAERGEGRKEK